MLIRSLHGEMVIDYQLLSRLLSARSPRPRASARTVWELLRWRRSTSAGDASPGASEDDLLRKLRIVADDAEGRARLTLAGVLLCAEEPQRWLPHAYVQAVSYAGERTDADYQTDARDIGGPLDQQVAESLHFVRRNMLVRATKETARVERPQFSDRAVFEALVNAVAHRDYSMSGARVRLHLFGDRLELYVPGALANTLTPDSLHLRQATGTSSSCRCWHAAPLLPASGALG